jgi:hypothetical protein
VATLGQAAAATVTAVVATRTALVAFGAVGGDHVGIWRKIGHALLDYLARLTEITVQLILLFITTQLILASVLEG